MSSHKFAAFVPWPTRKKFPMRRRILLAVWMCGLVAACSGGNGGGSPTSPTPTAQTRVIRLEGDMAFGNIQVGQSFEARLRVHNSGTGPLTVTGFTGPSGYTASWTNGTVPSGSFQESTIRFSPTEARTYNGTLTVNGDQTSGTNTIAISGTGVRERFSRTGSNNTVFDMPTGSIRVRIIGTFGGFCQNFVVKIGGDLVVNEILGTCSVAIGPRYDGTHLTRGGVVEITNSSGVSWSFEEIR